MTIRQAYEFTLIECNKLKAPSVLLEDFLYLFNKAIQQYINMAYHRAEYNQQSSDDLSFLQTTSVISTEGISPVQEVSGNVWHLKLPKDYWHLLNCIAEFTGSSKRNCNLDTKTTVSYACQRLTADLDAGILNNYYMKPSYKKPYYYIINHNQTEELPTNPNMDTEISTGSYKPNFTGEADEYRFYTLKQKGDRCSHQSSVEIDIYCGRSDFNLNKIYVTYLKSPQYVSMTFEELEEVSEDNSQILEFPDYICYEIINICVRLLLENASDPRLQTNIPINQTIMPQSN